MLSQNELGDVCAVKGIVLLGVCVCGRAKMAWMSLP